MLDLDAPMVLEGDPLGLRALEEAIAWRGDGPLPDWLDGTDLEDPDADLDAARLDQTNDPPSLADELPASGVIPSTGKTYAVLDLPELPPVVAIESPCAVRPAAPPLSQPPASVVEASASAAAVTPAEDLVSINDILRFVDDASFPDSKADVPAAPSVPQAPPPLATALPAQTPAEAVAARRFVSFEELLDARQCLLTAVANDLWAIPLDRIVAVTRNARSGRVIDLHERQEGKPRRGKAMSIVLDNDTVLLVDRVLGPRSFGWDSLPSGSKAPLWQLAQTAIGGETVGLLDWETLVD